jgi:two-component system CheB/CheR fusion protein
MIVNEAHSVIHLIGETSAYFRPRQGAASLELTRLLPDPLVPIAMALLYKAERDEEYLMSDAVNVSLLNGERRSVRVSVQPLKTEERLWMLSFHAQSATDTTADAGAVDVDAETLARVSDLERELVATRESLQATIEALETSNEELQATNEELMASNEELQSSNEELQSINEEINTVNAELQEKMHILNRTNADLDSMAKAAGVATVFVDEALLITRYSPDAMKLFRLRESDIGRPLDDIQHVLQYPRLMSDLQETLQSNRMVEREVETNDARRIFLTRILPYVVPSSSVRGAVVTFVDVSAFHDAKRLQTLLDALPEHIAVLDPAGRIVLVNAAWRLFAMANGDADLSRSGVGVNYLDVCRVDGCDDGDEASEALHGLRRVLEGSLSTFSLEYPCHSPSEERWFVMNVAPVHDDEFGVIVSHVNISSWYRNRQ